MIFCTLIKISCLDSTTNNYGFQVYKMMSYRMVKTICMTHTSNCYNINNVWEKVIIIFMFCCVVISGCRCMSVALPQFSKQYTVTVIRGFHLTVTMLDMGSQMNGIAVLDISFFRYLSEF